MARISPENSCGVYSPVMKLASRAALSIGVILLFIGVALFMWALNADAREAAALERFSALMASKETRFPEKPALYAGLLRAVGAAKAQDALLDVAAPTTLSHQIGHEAGYYLYETRGIDGILQCKNYFNGSCYHGFLERYIVQHGIESLEPIIDACKRGATLYERRECSHGAGHGFLVVKGYDHLSDALTQCSTSFSEMERAVSDCYDGVFMENNLGAFNVPPEGRMYKADDPLYPCNDPQIQANTAAHDSCWFMQSQMTLNPVMYPFIDGDIEKAAQYCRSLSGAEKRMCFMGLSRQIQTIAANNAEEIVRMCGVILPSDPEQCYSDAAESAYAFGARDAAQALCSRAAGYKDICFSALFERIATTAFETKEGQRAACEVLPGTHRAACLEYIDRVQKI